MNRDFSDDPRTGWRFQPPGYPEILLAPEYRGAFEPGEIPPKHIFITTAMPGRSAAAPGAAARFRSPRGDHHRSFGVSLTVDPDLWEPAGTSRGWFFFRHGDLAAALWSSLPATWLAQNPDGSPLPPPWRELWTFGTDHTWSIAVSRGGGRKFFEECVEAGPIRVLRHGGVRLDPVRLNTEVRR